jgi:hypothetical protein
MAVNTCIIVCAFAVSCCCFHHRSQPSRCCFPHIVYCERLGLHTIVRNQIKLRIQALRAADAHHSLQATYTPRHDKSNVQF